MKFTMDSILVMWILSSSFDLTDTFSTSLTMAYKNETTQLDVGDKTDTIDCKCNGTQKSVNLTDANLINIFSTVNNHRDCTPDIPEEICRMLESCEDCVANTVHCLPLEPGNDSCFNYSLEIKDNIFARDTNWSLRLISDYLQRCSYPSHPRTYVYYTMEYLDSLWAQMQCAYGYTLSDGIAREMECKYLLKEWKPKQFEECQPFVDCSLILKGPGKIQCSHGDGVRNIPSCQVWCYEPGKETTEPSVHICDIDMGWKPELPMCVDVDRKSDIDLATSPETKLQSLYTMKLKPREKCMPYCKTVTSKKKDLGFSMDYMLEFFPNFKEIMIRSIEGKRKFHDQIHGR